MPHARHPIARSVAAAQRLGVAAVAGLLLSGTAAAEDMEWVNVGDLSSSGGFVFNGVRPIAQAFAGTSELPEATARVVGIRVEAIFFDSAAGDFVGGGLSINDAFELTYRTDDAHVYPNTFSRPSARFTQADGSLTVIETENVNFAGRSSVFELRHAPVEIELSPPTSPFNLPDERRYYFDVFNGSSLPTYWITGSSMNPYPALLADDCLGGYNRDQIMDGNLAFALLIEDAPASAALMTRLDNSYELNQFSVIPPYPDTADAPGRCVGEVSALGDGLINLSDFSCYLMWWANGSPQADISDTGACNPSLGGDCVVNLSDFACYLSLWADAQP